MVYDITSSSSFERLKSWISAIREHCPTNMVIAIAGNKADLEQFRVPAAVFISHHNVLSNCKVVDRKIASEYAMQIGAIFLETSAKENWNVQEIFSSIGG